MTSGSIIDDMARRDAILNILHAALERHGISLEMNRMDFHLREKVIVEQTTARAGLSAAILDFIFPKEPVPSTVYHYTGLDAFRAIISSGELRLRPVRNRLGQGGELEAFAQAHGLDGYLNSSDGEEFYKILSDDLFYVSLTRAIPKDPSLMWGVFSGGTGVRLEFMVEPKPAASLRPIYYERSGATTLLREINEALRIAGEPPFIPWTISRIGAFYLNWTVATEDEVRLLIKRHRDGVDCTKTDGTSDYWPIPLDQANDFCDLKLTGIHVAPNGSRDEITSALNGTRFSKVPVTGP
ncbi:hypothetical protein [Hoeflea sp.]|uniref:hypothetical protein n=1 Tax=Hoeflea sp. TaxID=1940281 RepID=UPI003A8F5C94